MQDEVHGIPPSASRLFVGKSPELLWTQGATKLALSLRNDYLNTPVLGTPRCCVVAGDRVAVPVALGR